MVLTLSTSFPPLFLFLSHVLSDRERLLSPTSNSSIAWGSLEKMEIREESSATADCHSIVDLETLVTRNLELSNRTYRRKELFTIFRVPASLLPYADMDVYEPKIVSVGPYHRGKKHLKLMEDYKYQYLNSVLKRNPTRTLKDYLREMEALESRARSCYSEVIPMDSVQSVEMLLLDSCFIVEVLLLKNDNHPMVDTTWIPYSIAHDMLRLENQIPFFVLQTLYDMIVTPQGKNSYLPTLCQIATDFFTSYSPSGELSFPAEDFEPDHLLHLYTHTSIYQNTTGVSKAEQRSHPLKGCLSFNIRGTLVGMLVCSLALCGKSDKKRSRTARELHDAGVRFKIRTEPGSFSNVTFRNGVVEMLPLRLYDGTIPIFRNVIALEQCNWRKYGLHYTSYSSFMDQLIDTPADVELLEQERVVQNRLGSNEKAAQFFNELGTGKITIRGNDHLKYVRKEIEGFCNSKCPRWRAKLTRYYFSNPWAILSLLAAVILLLLTVTQTIFTVLPYVQS